MDDWDEWTTQDAGEGPQWVSAAEAADAAGVTPGTVRYWARAGLIVSEVVAGPAGERTLVRLDEVLSHARREGAASTSAHGPPGGGDSGEVVIDLPARTSELAPILKSVPEIMAQLTAATDRAARAETKVEFLSAQLQDLRRRLAEAGLRSTPEPTLPEAWEVPAEPPESPAAPAETDTRPAAPSPGGGGWPSPPGPEVAGVDWGAATSDAPAEVSPGAHEEAEPVGGAVGIDWGAGAPVVASEPREGFTPPSSPEPEEADRFTREELWAHPPPKRTPPPPPPPPPPAGGEGLDWHSPASSRVGGEEDAPPESPSRRANAMIPDEDLYEPRGRPWYRRRR